MEDIRAPTDEDDALRRRRAPSSFSVIGQKLITYWVLARFPERLMLALFGVTYMLVFGRAAYNAPLYNIPLLIVAFVIISLKSAGSCAINDYFDREADAINKPNRPIPAGNISPRGALQYTAVTFVIGAALALYLNLLAFAIFVFWVILFIIYVPVFKRAAGFLSNVVIAFTASFIPIFGEALLLGHISYLSLSFAPTLLAGSVGYNALLDATTVEGDIKAGYTTLAATRGTHAAITTGSLIMLVPPALFAYIPFILGIVGIAYAIVTTFYLALAVIVIRPLFSRPDPATASKAEKVLRTVVWVFLPIALLAGAFLP
jgi:geranylgeranylglycerol-phosphate geranylgeranyltransferase